MLKKASLLGLLFGLPYLLSGLSWAQPLQQYFRLDAFGIKEGLSHGTVLALAADDQGFLWAGTANGLNRFDGRHFYRYQPQSNNPHSLGHNYIRDLLFSSDHHLWIATRAGGIARYRPQSDDFVTYRKPHSDGAAAIPVTRQSRPSASDHISALAQQNSGTLWAGSDVGLLRYERKGDQFVNWSSQHALPQRRLNKLSAAPDGILWLAYAGGDLLQYNPTSGQSKHWGASTPECPKCAAFSQITALLSDRPDEVLLGTRHGLFRFTPSKHTVEPLSLGDGKQPYIRTLARSQIDELIVGTYVHGAFRVTIPIAGKFKQPVPLRTSPLYPQTLGNKQIFSLYVDIRGYEWYGTYSGLYRLSPYARRLGKVALNTPRELLDKARWVSDGLRSYDGAVWLTQLNGGLWRLSPDLHHARQIRLPFSRPYTITQDVSRRLWVGFDGDGLIRFDPNTMRYVRYGAQKGLPETWITRLTHTADGRLWAGTSNGLYYFLPSKDRWVKLALKTNNTETLGRTPFITDVHADKNGILWLGTTTYGLIRFDPASGSITLFPYDPKNPNSPPHSFIYRVLPDNNGVLWLATRAGLSRFDTRHYQFDNYDVSSGLPGNVVYGLVRRKQTLWIATEGGIAVMDLRRRKIRKLGVREGLFSRGRAYGAFVDAGESILLGLNGGFIQLQPGQLDRDPRARTVPVLESLSVAGKPVLPHYLTPGNSQKATPTIEIDHDHNEVSLNLGLANIDRTRDSLVEYRLKGFDHRWRRLPAANEMAHYTNLPAGTFDLELRAVHPQAGADRAFTPLRLHVAPPGWWNPLAWFVYAISLVAIIGFWWHRKNQMLHAQQQLNERLTQADRTKDQLLANVSHELRTPLNGIAGMAQILRSGMLGTLNPEALEAVDDILNAGQRLSLLVSNLLSLSQLRANTLVLSKRMVLLKPMLVRLERLLRRELPGHEQVSVQLRIDDQLRVYTDPLVIEQVFTNLLHNALKFTDQGFVDISAERIDESLLFLVSDTGLGISSEALELIRRPFVQVDSSAQRRFSGMGLGLSICSDLLKQLGSELRVSSTPGEGSNFSFYLPAHPPGETSTPPSTEAFPAPGASPEQPLKKP